MSLTGKILVCFFLILLSGFARDSLAFDLRILVVLSDSTPLYQRFAKAFEQDLPQGMRVDLVQHAEDFDAQKTDLIVTVGVRAAYRAAEKSSQPLLAAMIPSTAYADLHALKQGSISAVYLDEPWRRQAGLLSTVLPQRKRIGVLYSANQDIAGLKSELARRHDILVARHLGGKDTLSVDLDDVLNESDVLLAVPDSGIYNANSIRNILMSSYRRGIPLVGFSDAYVRAGALCAIFSTPEQLAEQTAGAVASYARTQELPEPQFPIQYSIAVNRAVAATFGLVIEPDDAILHEIKKSSGGQR